MTLDTTTAIVIAIALAGGTFRGFAGFGAGLMMVPLLTLVIPAAVAVPMLIMLAGVGDLRLMPEVWRQTHWPRAATMGFSSMIGLPAGIAALKLVDAETTRTVVNVIVLIAVAALARNIRWAGAERMRVLVPAGIVSGVLSGVGAVGGPPIVLTLLSIGEPPAQTRATLVGFFTISGAGALIMMFFAGVLDAQPVRLAAWCAIPYFLAIHTGARVFKAQGDRTYRGVALAFLAVIAVTGLLWPR